jgi:hypothetical protein
MKKEMPREMRAPLGNERGSLVAPARTPASHNPKMKSNSPTIKGALRNNGKNKQRNAARKARNH